MDKPGTALLVMGCPEVPTQTSVVLYLANKLNKAGIDVTVAGTDAALKLTKVADPEGFYIKKLVDVDETIAEMAEKKADFDLVFAFMHSDAGVVYAATIAALSQAKVFALVFGKNAEALAGTIEFPAEKVVAKATHNPTPLKNKLDKVLQQQVIA